MQKVLGTERKFLWNRAAILFIFCALEGIVALIGSLSSPSEPGSAVLFGLSWLRLFISSAAALSILGFAFLAWSAHHQTTFWRSIAGRAEQIIHSPARLFTVFTAVFTLFLALLAVLLLSVSPAANELTELKVMLSRVGFLLIWAVLFLFQVGLLILLGDRTSQPLRRIPTPLRAGVLLVAAALVYLVFLKVYLAATWDTRLRGVENYIFLPALLLIVWGILRKLQIQGLNPEAVERLMMVLFIGVTVYIIYWHTAQWVKFEQTRDGFTWHLLAQSFLEGRLYLENLSSWWVGLSLGMAILSRLNVFILWLLLAGITIYLIQQETGRIPWKKMFFWAAQSAVPVLAAISGLLFYDLGLAILSEPQNSTKYLNVKRCGL